MDEKQAQQLYAEMIEANGIAHAAKLFCVSQHTLASAMYVAVHLEDSYKLLEVEVLLREQHDALACSQRMEPTFQGSVDLSLYSSLLQMARTRLMLLNEHK